MNSINSININLLPPEVFEKRRAERLLFVLIISTVVLVFVLFLIYTLLYVQVSQKKSVVEDLKVQSDGLKRKINILKKFETEKKTLQDQESILDKALTGEIPWHEILYEVGMVIPSDVWLTSLTSEIEGTSPVLRFRGYTFEHPSVAQWLIRLGEVKSLSNVWLEYSQQGDFEGQKVIEFETSANLSNISTSTSSEVKSGE